MLRNTFFMPTEALEADLETKPVANSPELDPNTVELPVDLFVLDGAIIIRTPIVAAGIDDISVSVMGDELTITKTSSLDPQKDAKYYIQECYWDRLSRSVTLPKPVDVNATKATLNDGVLTVTLPLLHKPSSKVIRVK